MYEYESSGTIIVRGCSKFKVTGAYPILFQTGSKAFVKAKALRGILEFIFIKTYHLNQSSSSRNGISPVLVYKDTFNRAWVEEELIIQDEALDYAEEYWNRINYEADYIGNKTCSPN